VACLLIVYLTAYYRRYYTTQSEVENWYLLVVHMNIGLAIFALTLLALFYRFKFARTARHHHLKRHQMMARTMHYTLYCLLLGIPVTAYVGVGIDFPLLGLVNFPGFMRFELLQTLVQNNFQILMIAFMQPFAYFHRDVGTRFILPILVFAHTGAAILNLQKIGNLSRITDKPSSS